MEIVIPLVLVILGLALVGVEIYLIPGMNVVGILGVLMMIFGVGYAFAALGLATGLAALTGTIGLLGLLGWVAWKSEAWSRFVLSTSLSPGQQLEEGTDRSSYLGQSGIAVTPLRTTGVVEIGDERVEVMTEGQFISAGSRVKVVAMDRRRLFVRPVEGDVPETPKSTS